MALRWRPLRRPALALVLLVASFRLLQASASGDGGVGGYGADQEPFANLKQSSSRRQQIANKNHTSRITRSPPTSDISQHSQQQQQQQQPGQWQLQSRSRAINLDYGEQRQMPSPALPTGGGGGGGSNFNDYDDLSDNPMAAYYNQLPPMMRKYSQQHKNKKPVYVSINQQTVNGLLSLLFLFLISVCGSIGSIFIISALTVIESLQTRGNCYLVSLALAHLLVSLFVIPSSALQIMAADGINSKLLCHYQWLTLELSLIVSQLSFFLIAIDNYLGYRSAERLSVQLAGQPQQQQQQQPLAHKQAASNNNHHHHHHSKPPPQPDATDQNGGGSSPSQAVVITPDDASKQQQQRQQNWPQVMGANTLLAAANNQLMSKQQQQQPQRDRALASSFGPAMAPTPARIFETIQAASPANGAAAAGCTKFRLADQSMLLQLLAAAAAASNQPAGVGQHEQQPQPQIQVKRPRLLGYQNCCGRLRVLGWISLIWLIAIAYTIHQHDFSYGPNFCQAANKYRPTNSSSNRQISGYIHQQQQQQQPPQPPIGRNYRRSLASAASLAAPASSSMVVARELRSARWDGEPNVSADRANVSAISDSSGAINRIKRSAPARRGLAELAPPPPPPPPPAILFAERDQLNSAPSAGRRSRRRSHFNRRHRGRRRRRRRHHRDDGSLSLGQSTTKATKKGPAERGAGARTDEWPPRQSYANEWPLPQLKLGLGRQASGGGDGGSLSLGAAPTATRNASPNEAAREPANELDSGRKRLRGANSDAAATAAAYPDNPGPAAAAAPGRTRSSGAAGKHLAGNSNETAAGRSYQVAASGGARVGEIIWPTHCDSCHRNSSQLLDAPQQQDQQRRPSATQKCAGRTREAPRMAAAAAAAYGNQAAEASVCQPARKGVERDRPIDGTESIVCDKCETKAKQSRRRRRSGRANRSNVGPLERLALNGPHSSPMRPRRVALEPNAKKVSLSSSRAHYFRSRAKRTAAAAAAAATRPTTKLAPAVAEMMTSPAEFGDVPMPSSSSSSNSNNRTPELMKSGPMQQPQPETELGQAAPRWFWLMLHGTVIGPSLISVLLFVCAYLRMREFKLRAQKPLSLASIGGGGSGVSSAAIQAAAGLLMPSAACVPSTVLMPPPPPPPPSHGPQAVGHQARVAPEVPLPPCKSEPQPAIAVQAASGNSMEAGRRDLCSPPPPPPIVGPAPAARRRSAVQPQRSLSQPSGDRAAAAAAAEIRSSQQLGQSRLDFSRAEYMLNCSARNNNTRSSNNSNTTQDNELVQLEDDNDDDDDDGDESARQAVNHVFSVPVSQLDFRRQRLTGGGSPIVAPLDSLQPRAASRNFNSSPNAIMANYDQLRANRGLMTMTTAATTMQQQHQHQPPLAREMPAPHVSFSAPASATFIRPQQFSAACEGVDLFDSLMERQVNKRQCLQGEQAAPPPPGDSRESSMRLLLTNPQQQQQQPAECTNNNNNSNNNNQYEFKRRQHHAQSFHYGSRQLPRPPIQRAARHNDCPMIPIGGRQPGSHDGMAVAAATTTTAAVAVASRHQQQQHATRTSSRSEGRHDEGPPSGEHSLERHRSLPSSSRLHQFVGPGDLHSRRAAAATAAAATAFAANQNAGNAAIADWSAQPSHQQQQQPLQAPGQQQPSVASDHYHRLHPALAAAAAATVDRSQQLASDQAGSIAQALANVIKPTPADGAGSSWPSSIASNEFLNLPSSNQQQQQHEADYSAGSLESQSCNHELPNIKPTTATTTTTTIARGARHSGSQPPKRPATEEPFKMMIVCAYPYMIDDQLLKSNILAFVLNLALWIPFIIMSIVSQYKHSLSQEFKDSVWWMATLNCCSCSYVYALTNKDFREAFNKLFYYCCCKSHVTFQRKTPIFRRQLDIDSRGNLRIHIIPGLNVYSNKLSNNPASNTNNNTDHYQPGTIQLGANQHNYQVNHNNNNNNNHHHNYNHNQHQQQQHQYFQLPENNIAAFQPPKPVCLDGTISTVQQVPTSTMSSATMMEAPEPQTGRNGQLGVALGGSPNAPVSMLPEPTASNSNPKRRVDGGRPRSFRIAKIGYDGGGYDESSMSKEHA